MDASGLRAWARYFSPVEMVHANRRARDAVRRVRGQPAGTDRSGGTHGFFGAGSLSVAQLQQIEHEAFLAAKAGDLPDARDKYMTIIRDAGFPALTSATQHSILHAGALDNQLHDWSEGRSLLLRASAMQGARRQRLLVLDDREPASARFAWRDAGDDAARAHRPALVREGHARLGAHRRERLDCARRPRAAFSIHCR